MSIIFIFNNRYLGHFLVLFSIKLPQKIKKTDQKLLQSLLNLLPIRY